MLVNLSNTVWLNVVPRDVARIDINAVGYDDLVENAAYYVEVAFTNGKSERSDSFKTIEEARTCVESFVQILNHMEE